MSKKDEKATTATGNDKVRIGGFGTITGKVGTFIGKADGPINIINGKVYVNGEEVK